MDINEEMVVKNLMQTTREELQELVVKRVELEKQVDEHYAKIEQEQQQIAEKLEQIHHFRDQESSLESKMLLLQKEAFLDKIQPQKLKKIITESQVFKTVVQKGKDFKQALDGSIMDDDWLDERYEAYRKLCIQNGTELKSKEEFKEYAINMQKQEDSEALPLPDLFAFARRKISKAGNLVKDFLNPVLDDGHEIKDEEVQPKPSEEVKAVKKEKAVETSMEEVKEPSKEKVEAPKLMKKENKNLDDGGKVTAKKKEEEEEDNPFTNEVQVVETKKEVVIPTKADLFKEWIKAEKVTKKVVATKEAKVLYESYVKYLTAKEVDVKDKQLAYSYGGGVFGKALKNYYPE